MSEWGTQPLDIDRPLDIWLEEVESHRLISVLHVTAGNAIRPANRADSTCLPPIWDSISEDKANTSRKRVGCATWLHAHAIPSRSR